jgi:hypothetical protein
LSSDSSLLGSGPFALGAVQSMRGVAFAGSPLSSEVAPHEVCGGSTPGRRIVVPPTLTGVTPEIRGFINLATRFRPTRIPCSSRSSA